jgi:TPR repeat protein
MPQTQKSPPQIKGLTFKRIENGESGDCFYNAVDASVKLGMQTLRNLTAKEIEDNYDQYFTSITDWSQKSEDTPENICKPRTWASNVAVKALKNAFRRKNLGSIVIIGYDGKLADLDEEYDHNLSSPIFILYNGNNHYEPMLLDGSVDARTVLATLIAKSKPAHVKGSVIKTIPKQEQPSSSYEENIDSDNDDVIDHESYQTEKADIEEVAVDNVNLEDSDLPTFVSLTEEFNTLLAAAQSSNDPLLHYTLACKYRDGIGTEKNADQAQTWFDKVINRTQEIKTKANLNHARAQYVYGLMLRDGFADIKKNIFDAQEYLLSAAELGDRDAQYELAMLLGSDDLSKSYLKKAIMQGNTLAVFKSLEEYWVTSNDNLLQLAITLGYTIKQFRSSYLNKDKKNKYWSAAEKSKTKTLTDLISQVMKSYKKKHDTESLAQLPKEAVTISLPKSKVNSFIIEDFVLPNKKIKFVSTNSKEPAPKLSNPQKTDLLEQDSVKEISEEDIGKEFDQEEIKKYRLAAKQGIASAQYSLGMIYEMGLGVQEDINIAARWYHKAAKQNHDKAQHRLEKLFDKARIEEYRLAAEHNGHSQEDAQYSLGLIYELGLGVEQNKDIAVKWYKKAAKKNHREAQYRLGKLFDIEQTRDIAAKWYKKAAKYEDKAKYRLEELFNEKEIKKYRLAAEQGIASAQYTLGVIYELGLGVDQNMGIAVRWYNKAAKQNHSKAQYRLGKIFTDKNGEYYSLARSILLLRQSAAQQIEESLKYLKKNTLTDDLTNKIQLIEALESSSPSPFLPRTTRKKVLLTLDEKFNLAIQKAKLANDPLDQFEVGVMYGAGLGVAENKETSERLIKKAYIQLGNIKERAKHDDPRAFYVWGFYLITAEDAEGNIPEIIKYLRKAAAGGDVLAQYILGSLFTKQLGDSKMAMKYMLVAAKNGYAPAQYKLAKLYRDELKDESQAKKWIHRAAQQGLIDAIVEMKNFSSNHYFWENYQRAIESGTSVVIQVKNNGSYRQKETLQVAKQEFSDMAKKGYRKGMYELGQLYHHRENSTQKDKVKAVKWYCEAAKRGCPKSLYEIARIYDVNLYDNNGLGHIPTQELGWYELAAEQGHQESQYRLGSLYYSYCSSLPGDAQKNKAAGLYWLIRAAAQEHTEAKKFLETIEFQSNSQENKQLQSLVGNNNITLADLPAQSYFTVRKNNESKQTTAPPVNKIVSATSDVSLPELSTSNVEPDDAMKPDGTVDTKVILDNLLANTNEMDEEDASLPEVLLQQNNSPALPAKNVDDASSLQDRNPIEKEDASIPLEQKLLPDVSIDAETDKKVAADIVFNHPKDEPQPKVQDQISFGLFQGFKQTLTNISTVLSKSNVIHYMPHGF